MPSNEIPLKVGAYSVVSEVGAGGNSRVYLARRDGSSELCVLKMLRTSRRTRRAMARAYREAKLAAYLDHPGIVRLLASFHHDDMFCIVYEFIEGQTLRAVCEALTTRLGMVPVDLAVSIALRVLDALAYTHGLKDDQGESLGIVHRDLSPANIMVSYAGEVKVIDFGAARADDMPTLSTPGQGLGTIGYASPEQVRGSKADQRADLYAIGAVLYEMLTGRPPVSGKSLSEALGSIFVYVPPPPSSVNSTIRKEIDDVIMRALEKRPEDRWKNAAEFESALHEAARLIRPVSSEALGRLVCRLFDAEKDRMRRMLEDLPPVEPETVHAHSTTDDITEPDNPISR